MNRQGPDWEVNKKGRLDSPRTKPPSRVIERQSEFVMQIPRMHRGFTVRAPRITWYLTVDSEQRARPYKQGNMSSEQETIGLGEFVFFIEDCRAAPRVGGAFFVFAEPRLR